MLQCCNAAMLQCMNEWNRRFSGANAWMSEIEDSAELMHECVNDCVLLSCPEIGLHIKVNKNQYGSLNDGILNWKYYFINSLKLPEMGLRF